MNNEIEFEVGKKYENMKGVYEVISVEDDMMLIQWETGEQVSTSVDLQARIIERIQLEKDMREAKKRAKARRKSRAAGGKMGEQFKGFADSDFKETISGTKWRNRNCLGGAVSKLLRSSTKLKINSWAVARKAAVQWQDMNHHRLGDNKSQAQLFAQIDPTHLAYGFKIERHLKNDSEKSDWNAFLYWLETDDHELSLNQIVAEQQLRIDDGSEESFGFVGGIEARDGQWVRVNRGESEPIDSLAVILKKIPPSAKLDFQIYQKAAKTDVIALGKEMANNIAALFTVLMPLYEVSATLEPK